MRHSVMHVCVMIMIMMMMICTCTLFHACTMHVMYEYMSCTIVVAVLPACRRLCGYCAETEVTYYVNKERMTRQPT